MSNIIIVASYPSLSICIHFLEFLIPMFFTNYFLISGSADDDNTY